MTDLSRDEGIAAADALIREATRLEQAVRDYRAARTPNNPAVKAMADEGAAEAGERAKKLRELAVKIDPRPQVVPKPSTGIGGRVRETS
jgi:hypothetical protein